jgi:hypothetical protein
VRENERIIELFSAFIVGPKMTEASGRIKRYFYLAAKEATFSEMKCVFPLPIF